LARKGIPDMGKEYREKKKHSLSYMGEGSQEK
jgi:hypothetical protein